MKEKIKGIIENNSSDLATDLILDLFNENKCFRLSFLDGQGFEQETNIWAKNKDESLYELEKICPNATEISINKF